MASYRVWFELGSLDVTVEADKPEDITEDDVVAAVLDEHGKYIRRDIRLTMVDDWHLDGEIE